LRFFYKEFNVKKAKKKLKKAKKKKKKVKKKFKKSLFFFSKTQRKKIPSYGNAITTKG